MTKIDVNFWNKKDAVQELGVYFIYNMLKVYLTLSISLYLYLVVIF